MRASGLPKPHDVLRFALEQTAMIGVAPEAALRLATSGAAAACGLGDIKGRLARASMPTSLPWTATHSPISRHYSASARCSPEATRSPRVNRTKNSQLNRVQQYDLISGVLVVGGITKCDSRPWLVVDDIWS